MESYFDPAIYASGPFEPSPQVIKKSKKEVEDFVKDLECEHHINVPDDFSMQLLTAHCRTSGMPFSIDYYAVEVIIRECRKWMKYLSYLSDFDRLVCSELISMASSHVAVLSAYFSEKAGIKLATMPRISSAIIIDRYGNVHEMH